MTGLLSRNLFALKTLVRLLFFSVVLSGASLLAPGQTATPSGLPQTPPIAPPQAGTSGNRTNVDETFELNIDERRYSQPTFEAETAVGIKNTNENLNLQVGVALTSGRIDVLMRNVRGRVHFRGTLDRIFEIFSNRQASSPKPVPAISTSP